MRPAWFYDIETENWTTFVVGALISADGKCYEVYDWRREDDFIRRLAGLQGEVYAHNGGKFDHLWLLDGIIRLGIAPGQIKIKKNSAGIISIRIGDADFRDTYRIFPMSLAKLSGGSKGDVKALCICGVEGCGGYCAIRRDAPPSTLRKIVDYLELDVKELSNAVDHFECVAAGLDLDIGSTIGLTAWASAKKALDLDPAPFDNRSRWEFAKDAYYGGRVEIYRQYSGRGFKYDINSSYPAQLCKPLPVGKPTMLYGSEAAQAFRASRPGVYCARVNVPDCFIPPLPCRRKNRIGYPTGRFSGTWVYPELAYAESQGVAIEAIEQALVFPREEVIFRSWVEAIYKTRLQFGKGSREGLWLKLVPNSLTGKLGSRCEMSTIIIEPTEIRGHGKNCPGGMDCDGMCGAYRPLTRPGINPAIYESTVWKLQDCAHVEWSGYVTGYGRVEFHKQATAGSGDAIYGDTDSCLSLRERTYNVGPRLGEWLYEGNFSRFMALAPKVYAIEQAGQRKIKAKGIPARDDWDKLVRGDPIDYFTFSGQIGEGRFFVRRPASRRVTKGTGLRMTDHGGITRAPSYDEFTAKVDGKTGAA